MSSFKENAQIFLSPLALPKNFNLENFFAAEKFANLSGAMGNSFLITGAAELLTLVLAFPAAYAIARIKTRLSTIVESIFGFGFLIPAFAILLPIFLLMAKSGLLYKPLSLILFYPATRLPITILIIASYLRQVPLELEECAQLDGASRLHIIIRILFPLTAPGVITVVILNFIAFWNEFMFALILLNTQTRTVQLAFAALKGEHSIDYGLIAAGIILSILPVYITFIFFQERIVEGMMAGSVKG